MNYENIFSQFGFAGAVTGTLFFLLWRMLTWVMAFIKEDRKQQTEERQVYACRLEKLNDAIDKTANNIVEHDRRAEERGKFVRAEHEKMILNLEEQGKVLARINGYKDSK